MEQDLSTVWFKFFPSDWITSIAVRQLSVTAEGCYMRLLCHCWVAGDIPRDRAEIAGICRYSGPDLDAAIAMFTPKGSNTSRLYHPVLEGIREKAILAHLERSRSGKKGAARKWQKTRSQPPLPKVVNG